MSRKLSMLREASLLIILLLTSCSKASLKADLPMYLVIESPELATQPDEGSATHLITEAWIYADSLFLGTFPVPSRVPLLNDGSIKIDVFAGIRENGIAADIGIYPFYEPSEHRITFEQLATANIHPVFRYDSRVRFAWVEGFDSGNIFGEDLDGDPTTGIVRITDGGLSGVAGKSVVTMDHPLMEVATSPVYTDLPSSGAAVFLELDYRSEIPLTVGTRHHSAVSAPQSIYKLVLLPNDKWQKIYVNFTEDIFIADASGIQIIFLASFDQNLGLQQQAVYLDNIKLLHF